MNDEIRDLRVKLMTSEDWAQNAKRPLSATSIDECRKIPKKEKILTHSTIPCPISSKRFMTSFYLNDLPSKIESSKSKNYCIYHHMNVHKTDTCPKLASTIEKMIQRGTLKLY